MDLTEKQQQAIEYSGKNLQLIACAGSGKTEVVARRVAICWPVATIAWSLETSSHLRLRTRRQPN